MQFLKRKRLHSVVCSTGYKPRSVSRKRHRRMSEWYRNISKKWFRGVIRKLPRRWQRCIIKEEICWASSFVVCSLKVIQLLQMRWVQTISECPSYIVFWRAHESNLPFPTACQLQKFCVNALNEICKQTKFQWCLDLTNWSTAMMGTSPIVFPSIKSSCLYL